MFFLRLSEFTKKVAHSQGTFGRSGISKLHGLIKLKMNKNNLECNQDVRFDIRCAITIQRRSMGKLKNGNINAHELEKNNTIRFA